MPGIRSSSTSDRWQALAAKGAMPQRLLWASTGTKNPDYPDTLYLDSLIGTDTVNTVPPKTMDAFRDHGTAAETLTQDVDGARHVLAEAERLGLDLPGVTDDVGRRRASRPSPRRSTTCSARSPPSIPPTRPDTSAVRAELVEARTCALGITVVRQLRANG